MKTTKYIRAGKTIKNIEKGKTKVFESVNKAKRESRKIQSLGDGALGWGTLQVAE